VDPKDIFGLIVKADERMKYATDENRDLRKRQARELLVRALDAARASGHDELVEQVETRLSDLGVPSLASTLREAATVEEVVTVGEGSILILGGYGETGRRIAELLPRRTARPLVIAGRDASKARLLAEDLGGRFPGAPVVGARLDAQDVEAARRAMEGVALFVNATTSGVPGAAVTGAAIDAGADVIDLQYPAWDAMAASELAARAETAGRCVVTQAGFHPGVPAALVRWAAARVPELETAWVGGLLRQSGGFPYTPAVDDLVLSFRGYRAHLYRDGQWERIPFTRVESMPAVWFDFGFGRQRTALMDLDEMLALPELVPSIRRCGFSVAGFDPITDWVVGMLIFAALPFWGRRPVKPLSKLLCWSTRTFSRPPYGIVVQLEAEGHTDGRPVGLRLGLFHQDGYDMTAIPAVSMIEQLLDGSARRPGLQPMGLAVDPDRLLADLLSLGARVRLCGRGAVEGLSLGRPPRGVRRRRSRPS